MALGGVHLHVWEALWANLAPSWRPKGLQNRVQNPKKSMLKNDAFLASILGRLGGGFGLVFGRFSGPKIHAKSDLKKSVRQAKSIGKTNTKSMSALLRQSLFRIKIAEKSHVCWNIVFRGVLDGFWKGFGRPNSLILALFSMFFRSRFWSAFRKAKKSKKSRQKQKRLRFWAGPAECAEPGGEIERG